MMKPELRFCVVGAGTAGLISALLLRRAFPLSLIDVVYSDDVGIVGVGEGSTEHWSSLMRIMGWSPLQLIHQTDATHKVGIRFEGWTEHTPSYFHSIRGNSQINEFGFPMTYSGFVDQDRLASDVTGILGVEDGWVAGVNPHSSVNQYHFDTFKLNNFMREHAKVLSINFIEGRVSGVVRSVSDGNIERVLLESNVSIDTDFVIDASGFKREILSGHLDEDSWVSFSDFLLVDSAVAGPVSHSESDRILPFTRAVAQPFGWTWEIPTVSRRGRGYVYSSAHTSSEDAELALRMLPDCDSPSFRHFSFDPGYISNPWKYNCCAVGLSSSFVEPLEATSIAVTINQVLMLIQNLAGYSGDNTPSRNYNKLFADMMTNVLDMIRLHYLTDLKTSSFWVDANNMKVPDSLQEKLEIWQHRPPLASDFSNHWSIFKESHFFHVAQGQGLLGKDACSTAIDRFNQRSLVESELTSLLLEKANNYRIQHAEALKKIFEVA